LASDYLGIFPKRIAKGALVSERSCIGRKLRRMQGSGMDQIHSFNFQKLQGRLGDVVYSLTKVQFTSFCPKETWRPAVNVYRCHQCFVLCIEVAGINPARITLRLEPRRVLIAGNRQPPVPEGAAGPPVQILALEIDEGPFQREIKLPLEVVPTEARVEEQNGLLWIYLPLQNSL
jgi:HSP20 family protein